MRSGVTVENKFSDRLGRFFPPVRLLVYALAIVVGAVTLGQVVNSNQTTLTSWKGGGFGMYTDPHPNNRIVWLVVESPDAVRQIRLMPNSERLFDERTRLDPAIEPDFREVQLLANDMRTYPRDELAEKLSRYLAALPWRVTKTGELSLVDGEPVAVERYRIEVFEVRNHIGSGSVRARNIFNFAFPPGADAQPSEDG